MRPSINYISWARLASSCQLGFISDPLIVSKLHNETHDPKGQENKILTIEKGRETLYRRHAVPVTSCSKVKYIIQRVSVGSQDCIKELKLECAYFRLFPGPDRFYCSFKWFHISSLVDIYYTTSSNPTVVVLTRPGIHWIGYIKCNGALQSVQVTQRETQLQRGLDPFFGDFQLDLYCISTYVHLMYS